MGGRIFVDSQPGQGSVFSFDIMLEKQKRASEVLQLGLRGIERTKVLIVCSNDNLRKMLSDLLDSWQCLCTAASSIETAMALINDNDNNPRSEQIWDAVLLDMNIHDTEKVETERLISALYAMNHCQVIMLTSTIFYGEVKKRFGSQASILLQKPVRQAELFSALNDLLNSAHTSSGKPDKPESIVEQRPNSETKKFNILLVEDSPVNQKVATAILQKLGQCPDVAAGGKEALEAMRNKVYDLVFMDCQMPEMDGYETTRIIRNNPLLCETPDVPIVAMTAHAMKGDREKCISSGMDDYISKPIRKSDLEAILAKYLGDTCG